MRGRATAIGLAVALLAVSVLSEAAAQSWSLDISAGRINYPLAPDVATAHVVGTLRYEPTPWVWLHGGGGLPMRAGDPFWTSAGGGGRWTSSSPAPGRAALGLDYAGEGFLFRDRLVNQTGSGAAADVLPFVRLGIPRGYLDVRGGWRGYAFSQLETIDRRGVVETGARLSYGGASRIEAESRLVHADGTTYPFVGAALVTAVGRLPLQARLHAGRWLRDLASSAAWSLGLTAPIGAVGTLWVGVRQDAPDPLYWNAARRSWSVGITRSLGRLPGTGLTRAVKAGTVTIRLDVRDAPGEALSIAGDFSSWRPMPMRREGGEWVVHLPLPSGVYHYAFQSRTGRWFVPASVPGRRDDGFGGHVAILVVS